MALLHTFFFTGKLGRFDVGSRLLFEAAPPNGVETLTLLPSACAAAPEELARPPVGLEFQDAPHTADMFDEVSGVLKGRLLQVRFAAGDGLCSRRRASHTHVNAPRSRACLRSQEAKARHAAACEAACEGVFAQLDQRHRERVRLDGHVGAVFERSPFCHAVVQGPVCAVFAGEIAGEQPRQAGGAGSTGIQQRRCWAALQLLCCRCTLSNCRLRPLPSPSCGSSLAAS